MDVTEVKVEAKKMVSDGAYGHEVYSVGFTITLSEDETPAAALAWAQSVIDQAHDIVLDRLKRSISQGIRERLETRGEREQRRAQERELLRRAAAEEVDDAPIDLTDEQVRRLGGRP